MGGKTRNEIRAAPGQRRQQAQQNSHDGLVGLAFLHFESEDGHDFLEVFPDFALGGRITEQISGMIRRQQFSSGWRFSGGRHFTTLQMYTSLRWRPMASIIWVSSFPARPTKGNPCASSSAPGPSPTKTSCALGFPSPKTILCRVLWSLQRVHSPRSSRTLGSVSFAILSTASKSDGPAATGRDAIFGLTGVMAGKVTRNAGFPAGLGKVSSFCMFGDENRIVTAGSSCCSVSGRAATWRSR